MDMSFTTTLKTKREYESKMLKECAIEFSLLERKKLHIKKTVSVYEVTYEFHLVTKYPIYLTRKKFKEKEVTEKDYLLREITAEQLSVLRGKNLPSFVLKEDGKYFYTRLPANDNNLSRCNLLNCHMCDQLGRICEHLSAASDEKGGCAKVRSKAKKIENFDWIRKGYETFGTRCDSFVVAECEHFEEEPPRNDYN